ncbi:MAG: type II toxin-antitoxin system RelE/ParE family toxin [bacterium]
MNLKKKSPHGVKVIWTNSAIENLEGIFDYYKTKANLNVASDIINKIVDSTILLQFQPRMDKSKNY